MRCLLFLLTACVSKIWAYRPNDLIAFNDFPIRPVQWNDTNFTVVVEGEYVPLSYSHFDSSPNEIANLRFSLMGNDVDTVAGESEAHVFFFNVKTYKQSNFSKVEDYVHISEIDGYYLFRLGQVRRYGPRRKTRSITLVTGVGKDGEQLFDFEKRLVKIHKDKNWVFKDMFKWKKKIYLAFSFEEETIIIRIKCTEPWREAVSSVKLFKEPQVISFLPSDDEPKLLQAQSFSTHTELLAYLWKEVDRQIDYMAARCFKRPNFSTEHQPLAFIELNNYLENFRETAGCPYETSIPLLNITSFWPSFEIYENMSRKFDFFLFYHLGHDITRTMVVYLSEGELKRCTPRREDNLFKLAECSDVELAEKVDEKLSGSFTVDPRSGNLIVPVYLKKEILPIPYTVPLFQCEMLSSCESCEGFGDFQSCCWNHSSKISENPFRNFTSMSYFSSSSTKSWKNFAIDYLFHLNFFGLV